MKPIYSSGDNRMIGIERKMMHVIIRTDMSQQIGTGHVMRCMRLASTLQISGVTVTFLTVFSETPPWTDQAQSFNIHHLYDGEIREKADAHKTIKFLEQQKQISDRPTCLIVDHYGLGLEWERSVKPHVDGLVVIDDLIDRHHDCDLIINPSLLNPDHDLYKEFIPDASGALIGCEYAMLDDAFSNLDQAKKGCHPPRIFLSFGGMDRDGFTLKALDALTDESCLACPVDIVIGSGFRFKEELKQKSEARGKVTIHEQINHVAQVMAGCDIAIGAGGTMSWERLAARLPTLVFGIADNQKEVLRALLEGNLAVGCEDVTAITDGQFHTMIKDFVLDRECHDDLYQASHGIVDGCGVSRVARALPQVVFTFRLADMDDAHNIHQWRNDESIRTVSVQSTEVIVFNDHCNWMQKVIYDPDRHLYVVEFRGQACGVVRFDVSGDEAEISIYRVQGVTSPPGLVSASSQFLFAQRHDIKIINAIILDGNLMSQKAFENAGYKFNGQIYSLGRKGI